MTRNPHVLTPRVRRLTILVAGLVSGALWPLPGEGRPLRSSD